MNTETQMHLDKRSRKNGWNANQAAFNGYRHSVNVSFLVKIVCQQSFFLLLKNGECADELSEDLLDIYKSLKVP